MGFQSNEMDVLATKDTSSDTKKKATNSKGTKESSFSSRRRSSSAKEQAKTKRSKSKSHQERRGHSPSKRSSSKENISVNVEQELMKFIDDTIKREKSKSSTRMDKKKREKSSDDDEKEKKEKRSTRTDKNKREKNDSTNKAVKNRKESDRIVSTTKCNDDDTKPKKKKALTKKRDKTSKELKYDKPHKPKKDKGRQIERLEEKKKRNRSKSKNKTRRLEKKIQVSDILPEPLDEVSIKGEIKVLTSLSHESNAVVVSNHLVKPEETTSTPELKNEEPASSDGGLLQKRQPQSEASWRRNPLFAAMCYCAPLDMNFSVWC